MEELRDTLNYSTEYAIFCSRCPKNYLHSYAGRVPIINAALELGWTTEYDSKLVRHIAICPECTEKNVDNTG